MTAQENERSDLSKSQEDLDEKLKTLEAKCPKCGGPVSETEGVYYCQKCKYELPSFTHGYTPEKGQNEAIPKPKKRKGNEE
jgi:uncharacterized Zn finger protein (UPF0148 family)